MTENKVAVEQCDWDAAGYLARTINGLRIEAAVAVMAKAFARHRTRALEASQAVDAQGIAERCISRAIERLQKLPDYAGRPAWDQIVAEEIRAALTTPTRIEASHPQEAEVGESLREQAEAMRAIGAQSILVPIDSILATPPQAAESDLLTIAYLKGLSDGKDVGRAESGLLDEAIDLLRRIHPDPDYDTEQQYYTFLAKAGKQGEGDREG